MNANRIRHNEKKIIALVQYKGINSPSYIMTKQTKNIVMLQINTIFVADFDTILAII